MPLVLARGASRRRCWPLQPDKRDRRNPKVTTSIEHGQTTNGVESIEGVFHTQPKTESRFSEPMWNVERACWLVYYVENTSKWMVWDDCKKKWVDISDYDKGEFGLNKLTICRALLTREQPTEPAWINQTARV